MPTEFSFSASTPVTPTYLTLSQLTRGSAPGVNDPSQRSAVAPFQSIDARGDVDVFAVTLVAGQTYTFDVDGGAGDASGGSVNLEIDLIDHQGRRVLSDGVSSRLDPGSFSTLDPLLTVDVNKTGTYFLAVHNQADEYVNGTFRFSTGGTDTGDYALVVSTPDLPTPFALTSGSDVRSFGDRNSYVFARGGNDRLYLEGGDDVAAGESGGDTLYGGSGDDELSGGTGNDSLYGSTDDDVLVGGSGRDLLDGGSGEDALNGGSGNDDLRGSSGDDTLWGDAGDDRIQGGSGDDFIRGGDGVDRMQGNGGADVFHFLPGESDISDDFREDVILSFSGRDRIDLSDLFVGGQLSFRGERGYSAANQVRVQDYRDEDGDGYQEVRVNLDGDRSSELAFLVDTFGDFRLGSDDFIL